MRNWAEASLFWDRSGGDILTNENRSNTVEKKNHKNVKNHVCAGERGGCIDFLKKILYRRFILYSLTYQEVLISFEKFYD